MDRGKIVSLMRDRLGCQCPESSFEFIEWSENIKIDEVNLPILALDFKINVGNKALLYIYSVSEADDNFNNRNNSHSLFSRLIKLGYQERERAQFNRFRMVLTCSSLVSENLKDKIQNKFESIITHFSGKDRIHLHFVDAKFIGCT
ncbi:MAG: hypothetical protein ACTSVU_06450 [Promethearchaeota archaeon]